ncbi:MAG: GTPase Era [Alphaproteobacteria bacterium]|nr:GTPase Era [Alphaproteobacteria bacterium]
MKQRCGFVAVVGTPNAGKSTLVNALVGTKVSIVSPKVQTTRSRVIGIAIQGESQIVFVDTPGIFAPKKRLERAMVSAAWEGTKDADVVALVVDAQRAGRDAGLGALLDGLKESGRRCILVFNKVDLVEKPKLLALSKDFNDRLDFAATFMISALKEQGLGPLMAFVAREMPEGPWLFDEDAVSDMPMRLMAAEITREHIFRQLHEELPYGMAVHTEHWEEFENGAVKIDQVIFVSREAHKGIVLGKGGSRIKAIGEASRRELADIMETDVHLKLFVKVRENWSEDPEQYAALGLDFNV